MVMVKSIGDIKITLQMRKEEIIKYIEGTLPPERELSVQKWLQADERNMKYYAWLKALYVSQGTVMESCADAPDEMERMRGIVSPRHTVRLSIWRKISVSAGVAAVVLLGLFNLWYFISNYLADSRRVELAMVPNDYKHTIYTEKGVKARIVLPDSSKVLLNCDSKITFPDKFTGPTREVYVSGEAYFEVTSDSLCPMIVTTPKKFRVEVKGTTFCINAYEDNSQARATLVEGRVDLIKSGMKGVESSIIMHPDESYLVLPDNRVVMDPDENAVQRAVAWTKGVLIFDSTPMTEVISRLKRWYGVEFVIKDKDVLNWRITATFHSESIMRIMDMLEYTTFIEYTINENIITLRKKRN